MKPSTVDLHLHTAASDGASSPEAMLDEAISAGLRTISITDHESIEGLDAAYNLAAVKGLNLIPGVELLTTFKGREVHLLGYWFDMDNQQFRSRIVELRKMRNENSLETVEKMKGFGYKLKRESFIDIADQGITLGKNHIIISLINDGYIKTREQVIDILRRYLRQDGLAYVHFDDNPVFQAAEMIRESGGIPVLAHPGLIGDDKLVLELINGGNIGIEVYYYYFGDQCLRWVAAYERLARDRGLVFTGGSDYHGRYSPSVKLGKVMVPEEVISSLSSGRSLVETRKTR